MGQLRAIRRRGDAQHYRDNREEFLVQGVLLATIELRVLLIEAADALVSASLYCRLTLFVDDATVETVCTVDKVVGAHAKSVNLFVSKLHELRLKFSDTKNVVCVALNGVKSSICSSRVSVASVVCTTHMV